LGCSKIRASGKVTSQDRFLIDSVQAAISDIQTNGAILDGLEFVFNLLARYEIIEQLYLQRPSDVQKPLSSAIILLYTAVLEFLLEGERYYNSNTLTRVAKSIFLPEERVKEHISKLRKKQQTVDEYL